MLCHRAVLRQLSPPPPPRRNYANVLGDAGSNTMLRGFAVDMHDDFKPQFKEKAAQSVQESIAQARNNEPSIRKRFRMQLSYMCCLVLFQQLRVRPARPRCVSASRRSVIWVCAADVTPCLPAGLGQQQGVPVHEGRPRRAAVRLQPDGVPHPRRLR